MDKSERARLGKLMDGLVGLQAKPAAREHQANGKVRDVKASERQLRLED